MTGYGLTQRIDDLEDELATTKDELAEYKATVLFLARLLGKTMGQRDRARDLAVTLEQRLALQERATPNGWTPED